LRRKFRNDTEEVHRVKPHPHDVKRLVFWEGAVKSHVIFLQTFEVFFKIF